MAQVALAWSLSKDGVAAPIVGTTKLDNLKELISASEYFILVTPLSPDWPLQ